MASKKMQGGVKGMRGKYVSRSFGSCHRGCKQFWIKTHSGDVEYVSIGWMSKWLRPKVEAWWKYTVAQYKAVQS